MAPPAGYQITRNASDVDVSVGEAALIRSMIGLKSKSATNATDTMQRMMR